MQFLTPDNDTSLRSFVWLINSGRNGQELLATSDQLSAYLDSFEYTGRRDHDGEELDQVHHWREHLGKMWEMPETALVDEINNILATMNATPKLVRHDHSGWHFHVIDQGSPLADRLAAEAAMVLADIARGDELSRLGTCEAADCDNVLFDFSKNQSRRFCDSGNCANRTHVAAYRARQHAQNG